MQDVAADPTLPRTKSVRCSRCGHGEAVFFQVNFYFEYELCLNNKETGNRLLLLATTVAKWLHEFAEERVLPIFQSQMIYSSIISI